MYCQFCEEEQSPRSKFCKVCGAKLLERPPEKILADLNKHKFLMAEVHKWAETGKLPLPQADELLLPYRRRIEVLEVALAVARGGPIPEPALPPAPSQTAGGGTALLDTSLAGAPGTATPVVPVAPVAPPAAEIPSASRVLEAAPVAAELEPATEVLASPAPSVVEAPKPVEEPKPLPSSGQPAVRVIHFEQPAKTDGQLPPPRAPRNEIAQAAAASAAALASSAVEPMDFPEAPKTREQEIVERESTWSTVWKPFLTETILWFTGPFLLVAGAIFFARESSGVVMALVIGGILALYSGISCWVGRRMSSRPNLLVPSRILTSLSVALAPISILAIGWGSMKADAPGLLVGASVAFLAIAVALIWISASTFSQSSRTLFTAYAGFLLFLFAAVPFSDSAAWLVVMDAAGLVALWLYAPNVAEAKSDKGHAGFLGGSIAWFALVLFVRVHYQGQHFDFGWVEYGPLLALLVAVVLRAEKKLLDHQGGPSWLAALAYTSLVVPPIAVFATEARRFGPSFGVTCLILTVLLVLAALRYKSRIFLTISLLVGWFSFYALTGLIKLDYLRMFLGGFKSMTGYAPDQKLPMNYYFLASLIYVAGLAWAYSIAKKSSAQWALGVIRNFTLAGVVFLMVWSHFAFGTGDFKPALLTSAVVFAGALALSHRLGHWKLCYLSAAALVVLGLDVGLVVDVHSAPPTTLGFAAASLSAVAISIVLSLERARAFRDLALVGFALAVLLVPFTETGWTAASAWALTGLAGVASAFALGTGLPAAAGLMALAGAALHASHALHFSNTAVGWIAYGITFALLAGSGLEKVPGKSADRGFWFGMRLPLAAEGYAVLRGPMAFASLFVAITALVVLIGEAGPDAPTLAFGVFALAQLWLARRQPSVAFLTFALLFGCTSTTMAVGNQWHEPTEIFAAIAAFGVLCAALAVAVDRSTGFQKVLRIEPRRAGWTFVVHGCVFAGVAGLVAMGVHLDHHRSDFFAWPALALGAAMFLVLPRFNRWSGWLYPFQVFATAAVSVVVPTAWVTFVIACFAFAPLALALTNSHRPALAHLVSGVESKQLAEPVAILALLQALAAGVACFVVGSGEIAPLSSLAPATAALAVFFVLFPLLDGGAIWLSLAGIGAWLTVALRLPFEMTALTLAAFSAILVGIGALVALRWDKHGRVLATTGLGMAACAIAAFWYGWPAASVANAEVMFALVTLTLVIAPRVYESPLFLPVAMATGAFSLSLAAPPSDRSLWLASMAVAVAALAVSIRRFPKLAVVLFGIEKHFGTITVLSLSTSVLSLVAVGLGIAWGGQHLPLSGALGLATATFFLAFLAFEEPWFVALAGVLGVAALATLDVRPELAFLLAQAGVNAVFLSAGALAWSPTRGILDRVYDLFDPPGAARGVPRPTEKILSYTASSLAFVGLLCLCFISLWRIFAFGPLGIFESAWAPYMAGAQVLTALHQLRRRPMLASWHGLLVAILAGLWLLLSMPVWNYVAGVWALSLVLLAWATKSPMGGKTVDALSPGLSDAQVENLRTTLSGYSTATAFLGLQAIHPNQLESPVSWALLTATFALQALLGSGFGRVMFLIALPFAVHYAAFFVGIKLDTGRPQEVILPYLAASMAFVALLSERVGVWRKGRGHGGSGIVAAHLYGALAAVEWGCGLAMVHYGSVEVAACFVAGASLTLLWTLRALAEDNRLFAWLAELSFLSVYLSLRLQTDWLGPRGMRGDKDSLATLILGVLFVGLHTSVKKLSVPAFKSPTRFAALAMPVLSALLMAREASYGNAVLLVGVAMQLTVLSWVEGRGKLSGLLAAVAFNLALAMIWLTKGIGGGADAQYYITPAGFTLIVLTYLYGESLGAAWKARLRSVGVLCIYLASAIPALTFVDVRYLWWAVGLCFVGIFAGIAFRVRAYLYLGTGFMVASIVTNATRFGLRDHRVGAAILTFLGLVMIVSMVFFQSRRQELLERYRKYRQLMAEWE